MADRLYIINLTTEKRLRASAASDESWRELMEARPDPESLQWSRPVKVGKAWRIDCSTLILSYYKKGKHNIFSNLLYKYKKL